VRESACGVLWGGAVLHFHSVLCCLRVASRCIALRAARNRPFNCSTLLFCAMCCSPVSLLLSVSFGPLSLPPRLPCVGNGLDPRLSAPPSPLHRSRSRVRHSPSRNVEHSTPSIPSISSLLRPPLPCPPRLVCLMSCDDFDSPAQDYSRTQQHTTRTPPRRPPCLLSRQVCPKLLTDLCGAHARARGAVSLFAFPKLLRVCRCHLCAAID
jgi:hypothetical protein